MRAIGTIGAVALLGCVLAGCQNQGSAEGEADASQGEALAVRTVMKEQVNPATLAIWDIGNNAMNDAGGIDAAKMDAAKWTTLAEQADRLAAAGRAMGAAQQLQAAAPGDTAVAEGEVPMDAVQRALDADPEGFRQAGTAFAAHVDKLAAAARAQDAVAAGDLVAGMDQVCEACHAKYWYPEQQ